MTKETENKEESKPFRQRKRNCPACKEPVTALQMSAFSMPIEQYFIRWLLDVNRETRNSIRTQATVPLDELQLLAFTSICKSCGHISWWDLSVEEFENIIENPFEEPRLAWAHNPEFLNKIIGKISSESMKSFFESTLKEISKNEP
ncbi:hypothetical protein [Undibacterium baiyunense]|uniref:Uncharacterized protein n=1 Tax=Undibacterium baiyunense TaxID=2828731 RepID=A0A941I4F6_9BURK|nr:hypothetical protein [Undibacterium baiyunense]MBR7747426.1 hypothetical protein [Undibacterium baiyunense]